MTICVKQCDIDDCYELGVYDVEEEAAKRLIEILSVKPESSPKDFHICEGCWEDVEQEAKDNFEIDEYDTIIKKGREFEKKIH